jgi:hypothetical protein
MRAFQAQIVLGFCFFAVAACSHLPPDRCDVSDISAVFASPSAFIGQRFCGEAFYYGRGELGGLYDRPIETQEQRYSTAFLMSAGSGRYVGVEDNGESVRVFASGTISDVCSDGHDGEANCVPVRTAIFLEDWEVRRTGRFGGLGGSAGIAVIVTNTPQHFECSAHPRAPR